MALITGGDSGIGQAVAVAFAKEGASGIAIAYLYEREDAERTLRMVQRYGAKGLLLEGDLRDEEWCREVVEDRRGFQGDSTSWSSTRGCSSRRRASRT